MKFLPESRSRKIIYILILLIWVAIYGVGALTQCAQEFSALWLFFVTTAFLAVVLAWSISLDKDISPKGMKNISLLCVKTAYEILYLVLVYIVVLVPLVIVTPTYYCYNDRAENSEIIAVLSAQKSEISELISSSGTLLNDYSSVLPPEHKRIDYFRVTSEGAILAHANNPDFTIYLTPSVSDGELNWQCKAFPTIKAPALCR